jgi:hypothetical protein
MRKVAALRKFLPFIALLAVAAFIIGSVQNADAQQHRRGIFAGRLAPNTLAPNYGVGGYSLTLSDVWGPAKMPPAPKDFGPHFDFPPAALNGGVTQSPYPN